MSNALKGLKISVALIVLCVAIGLVMVIWNKSQREIEPHKADLINLAADLGIEDLVQNANIDITGAMVVTLAEKYRTVFPMVFVTGEVPNGFYDISFIREPTNQQYVNPSKIFRLEIDRDVNGDPEALVFLQAGCSKPAYDLELATSYVHKSQLMYNKMLAERNFQENMELYKKSITEYSEEGFKILTKDGSQETALVWDTLSEEQKNKYIESSQGLP